MGTSGKKETYKGIFRATRTTLLSSFDFPKIVWILGNEEGRTRKPARTVHMQTHVKTLNRKGIASNTISVYTVCAIEPVLVPKVLIVPDLLGACLAG